MDLITATYDSEDSGMPTVLVALVDEMQEDPHCRATLLGRDTRGAVLVTVWDETVGREVAEALASEHPELDVRRLELGPDAVMLG
jgi:hypothetical protein